MQPIIRLNDKSDHGGYMISAGGKFTNRGLTVCVSGDMHVCPQDGHGTTPVIGTSGTTKSGGKPIIRAGDKASCGATLLPSNSNVDSN